MPNRISSLVLTLLLFAGCASAEWHWTDPGVHVVAGAWVTEEVPCEMDAPDMCGLAVRAGRDWVQDHDPTLQITSGRWAQFPRLWVDSAGREHQVANGSLFGSSVAIMTLGSGDLWLVALLCRADTREDTNSDMPGRLTWPASCSPQGDVWGQYLVGAQPPPILGG